MIWATVSSRSCFCWLYRASSSLAAKNIINMTLVLTIWWFPCVESSLVLLEESVCYAVHFLGKTRLDFALLHSVFQGQICLVFFYTTLKELVSYFPLQVVHCQGIEIGKNAQRAWLRQKQAAFLYIWSVQETAGTQKLRDSLGPLSLEDLQAGGVRRIWLQPPMSHFIIPESCQMFLSQGRQKPGKPCCKCLNIWHSAPEFQTPHQADFTLDLSVSSSFCQQHHSLVLSASHRVHTECLARIKVCYRKEL